MNFVKLSNLEDSCPIVLIDTIINKKGKIDFFINYCIIFYNENLKIT